MGSITTRTYDGGSEVAEDHHLDAVSDLLAGECDLVWIDIDEPDGAVLQTLADELGLHPLSVEDALDPHQRDKYVHYEHHVFLVCHSVQLDVQRAELQTVELNVFIGANWLVTAHRGHGELLQRVASRFDRARQLAGTSVGSLMYAALDVVVDGYFDVIDQFEQYYDAVADQVFGESPIEPSEHRQWFEMRKALNLFGRSIRPLAEALATVVADDLDRFPDPATPYLRDVAGEMARAATEVDSLRELVNHIVDANLVLRDYRQNVVMKKVTSWAAIIAVPTLITGFYGMNVPYPGSGETWGVITSSVVALACSGSLYLLFRTKKWL